MFDSRTDKPVRRNTHTYSTHNRCHEPGKGDTIEWGTPKSRQLATRKATCEAIAEGIAAYLDEHVPAKDMTRMHIEALAMDANGHECFTRDCDLPAWECSLLAWDYEVEWRDEDVLDPYEDEADEPYREDTSFWLPYMTIEQFRAHLEPGFDHGYRITTRP